MINTKENTSKKFLHQKRFFTKPIEYNYDNDNNEENRINYYYEINNKFEKIKIKNEEGEIVSNKVEEEIITNEIQDNEDNKNEFD